MISINTNEYMKHINKAVTFCYQYKDKTDRNNAAMLRTYVADYYTKLIKSDTDKDPRPINMLDRTVSIWMPFLVGGSPKFIVQPKTRTEYQPFAYAFQLALNQWLEDMKFAERTLKKAVLNSLFSQGIVKTGTQRADIKRMAGYLAVTGKPYAENISQCNYLFDIVAKDREQYEFEGDEYLLPTDEAKEMFPKFADKIKPDYKLWGETDFREQINSDDVYYGELREYSSFIDLWLPKEKDIITIFPPHKSVDEILKTTGYTGSFSGPYDVLNHKNYPDCTVPIPPVYGLMELDAAINTLYTKARNQAERLKKIGTYEAGNDKDAETARTAVDGGMYGFTNVQAAVKEITLGGVVPEIYEFLGFTLNQFAEQSGVSGLDYRSRAKTLGQEEMLMSNSMRVANDMSQNVHRFAANIGKKLAEEMWRNPTIQISAIKKMAGIGEVPVKYDQLAQQGKFTDYQLKIEMYSMQQLSPQAQFDKLWQILTGVVIPTAPIMAQQGKIFNAEQAIKDLSNYANVNVEGWYYSDTPQMTSLNSFQPMGGTRSADTRFGSNAGDNMNNRLQQQQSNLGKTTKQ